MATTSQVTYYLHPASGKNHLLSLPTNLQAATLSTLKYSIYLLYLPSPPPPLHLFSFIFHFFVSIFTSHPSPSLRVCNPLPLHCPPTYNVTTLPLHLLLSIFHFTSAPLHFFYLPFLPLPSFSHHNPFVFSLNLTPHSPTPPFLTPQLPPLPTSQSHPSPTIPLLLLLPLPQTPSRHPKERAASGQPVKLPTPLAAINCSPNYPINSTLEYDDWGGLHGLGEWVRDVRNRMGGEGEE